MKSKADKIIAFFALMFFAAAVIGIVNTQSGLVYITQAADGQSNAKEITQSKQGNLLADAYRYCANRTVKAGEQQYDIAIAALDTNITEYNKLASLYLTGSEIKKIAELDASYSGNFKTQSLYVSGLCFEYNKMRPKLDKVSDIYLSPSMREKSRSAIDNDKVYRVAADILALEMIDKYSGYSLNLLKIPRDKLNEATDIVGTDGTVLNQQNAYDEYTYTFSQAGNEADYESLTSRKTEISTLNPSEYFKNTSTYFFIFFIIIVAFILIIVIIVRTAILRRHKKKVFIE